MTGGRLVVLVRDTVPLGAALASAAASLGNAVAMLSAPAAFVMGRVGEGGGVRGPDSGVVDLEPVFEARVFSALGELRWLAGEGSGRAALLLDVGPEAPPDGWERREPLAYRETFTRLYLLWGRAVLPSSRGWARLDEARIGPYDVPAEGGPYLRLEAREYVGERDGNACVVFERLVGLRSYQPRGVPNVQTA